MAKLADHMEKISDGVVTGYKKIEGGVVEGFNRIGMAINAMAAELAGTETLRLSMNC